ncbi:MAG: ABC transporter ATP-binding protein [Candidatus Eremiobacteraeota bacterium]|nr:ABC transporter ATP-binding protein [Candidatus Eremiobacteraeota bacterium]
MNTIEFRGLTKTYGKFVAVDDLSLNVESGTVFGLLGPNGAGKTTAFKCMLGLAQPTAGSVTFAGAPLTPERFQSLAYVPEKAVLYDWMTIADHVEMQRRSFKRFNPARMQELLDLFQLDPRKRARALSKGMKTALQVALAFAIEPEVLVLDEPTSGLDPINQRAVLNLIVNAAANGTTVIFSSHQIGQVERAADHIAVLVHGKLALTGAVDDLKFEQKVIEGIYPDETFSVNGYASDPRIARVDKSGRILRLTCRRDSDQIAEAVSASGAQGVRVVDLSLEDIFLNAVDGEQRADLVETAR